MTNTAEGGQASDAEELGADRKRLVSQDYSFVVKTLTA